jgi:hypothetical protein
MTVAILPDAIGVVRVAFTGTIDNIPYANVFHMEDVTDAGPWTQDDLDALVAGMDTAYHTAFDPAACSNRIITQVKATDLTTTTALQSTLTVSRTGAQPDPLPNNAAVCVSWHISRRYKGGHPRTYLGSVSTGSLDDQRLLTSSARGIYATAALGFLADVGGITLPSGHETRMVCVHYRLNKVTLTTPVVDLVLSASVDGRLDTQRRRLG